MAEMATEIALVMASSIFPVGKLAFGVFRRISRRGVVCTRREPKIQIASSPSDNVGTPLHCGDASNAFWDANLPVNLVLTRSYVRDRRFRTYSLQWVQFVLGCFYWVLGTG